MRNILIATIAATLTSFVHTYTHAYTHAYTHPRPHLSLSASLGFYPNVLEVVDPRTNKQVFLIGCVHGARTTAKIVDEAIREQKPSAVVLELCPSRLQHVYAIATGPTKGYPESFFTALSEFFPTVVMLFKKTSLAEACFSTLAGVTYLLQSALSYDPGLEFKLAIRAAIDTQTRIAAGDQDMKKTMTAFNNLLVKEAFLPSEIIRNTRGVSRSFLGWPDQHPPTAGARPGKRLSLPLLGVSQPQLGLEVLALLLPSTLLFTWLAHVANISVLKAVSMSDSFLYFLTNHEWPLSTDHVHDASVFSMQFLGEAFLSAFAIFDIGSYADISGEVSLSSAFIPLMEVGLINLFTLGIIMRLLNLVVLQRDIVIAQSIAKTCEQFQFTEGPVIAVVGLLHTNGIADILENAEPWSEL